VGLYSFPILSEKLCKSLSFVNFLEKRIYSKCRETLVSLEYGICNLFAFHFMIFFRTMLTFRYFCYKIGKVASIQSQIFSQKVARDRTLHFSWHFFLAPFESLKCNLTLNICS